MVERLDSKKKRRLLCQRVSDSANVFQAKECSHVFGHLSLLEITFIVRNVLSIELSRILPSVPHIRPPFCNLSASWKCKGGLYDILSREYAPSSGAMPRCWHRNIYYRPIEAGSTLICLHFSCPPETQWSRLTDRGWPYPRQRRFPSTPRVCPFNVL